MINVYLLQTVEIIRKFCMDWLEITINTTPAGIDPVCARLIAIGVEGMQIEDFDDFCSFLETNRQRWDYVDEKLVEQKRGVTAVKIYLSDNPSGRDSLSMVRENIAALRAVSPDTDMGTLDITVGSVSESDWESSWKQYYKPTPVGEKLLIVPEWEQVPQTNRAVFINNPGMSFGTGTHASTKLALEALELNISAEATILDLGCGSGILAICGVLMGAKSAAAIDIDPNAADTAKKNAALNWVAEKIDTAAFDLLSNPEKLSFFGQSFDIILANIVADVIIPLSAEVRRYMTGNSIFISSGIIEPRLDEVLDCLTSNGFEIMHTATEDGWAAVTAKLAE